MYTAAKIVNQLKIKSGNGGFNTFSVQAWEQSHIFKAL